MNLKNIKIYEDFDIEEFLEDPGKFMHDDSDPNIDIGNYVDSYRGPGQVVGSEGNFWLVRLLDRSQKQVKVPKDSVTKMKKEDAYSIVKRSSSVDVAEEINAISDDMGRFIEANMQDDPEAEIGFVFTGDTEKSFEYIEDALVNLIALRKKDSYLNTKTEYARLLSYMAFLFEEIAVREEGNPAVERRIDAIIKKIGEI